MQLDKQAIYNDLDYSWWLDNQPNDYGQQNNTFQSANIYFQDTLGNWHLYTSTGPCPQNPDGSIDPTTRQYYVENYLMWDTANWLHNGQCAGGITNIEPKEFQELPIYFK